MWTSKATTRQQTVCISKLSVCIKQFHEFVANNQAQFDFFLCMYKQSRVTANIQRYNIYKHRRRQMQYDPMKLGPAQEKREHRHSATPLDSGQAYIVHAYIFRCLCLSVFVVFFSCCCESARLRKPLSLSLALALRSAFLKAMLAAIVACVCMYLCCM